MPVHVALNTKRSVVVVGLRWVNNIKYNHKTKQYETEGGIVLDKVMQEALDNVERIIKMSDQPYSIFEKLLDCIGKEIDEAYEAGIQAEFDEPSEPMRDEGQD